MASIKDIIENTRAIYMTDSSINTLLDFERVIDELDLYAFENWKKGELVEGPIYEKYFVNCIFMWPYRMKPDTRGAERLAEYGCTVEYKKDVLEYPIKIKTPKDFKPGTKMPKMGKAPVWLVKVIIPKKLMQEIHQGSIELESGVIDSEDINQSYEKGLDDKMYQNCDQENQNPDQQQTGAQP